MKNIVVLGSTGSLGTQILEVLGKQRGEFRLIAISGHKNKSLLARQQKAFHLSSWRAILINGKNKNLLKKMASLPEADIIVNVLPGLIGTDPSLAALQSGKILILGNKESLVVAGTEMISTAKKNHGRLIPLDSEHNAIYEILRKYPREKVDKIFLPCSGGPFLGKKRSALKNISAKQALNHPRWKMGQKVSVESATLINKGLEIIEAHYLFNLPLARIKVFIHPQCQIHGIVKFKNGKSFAYVSAPDMREHAKNALLAAIKKPSPQKFIKPFSFKNFQMIEPDHETFPGIKCVLNNFCAAGKIRQFLLKEETLIEKLLQGKLDFLGLLKELDKLSGAKKYGKIKKSL